MIELYQQVFLVRDFPEYQLQKGDTATVVDTVSHPTGGEDGYVLEIFNVFGDSVDVITVPQSAVTTLQRNYDRSKRLRSKVRYREKSIMLNRLKVRQYLKNSQLIECYVKS